MLSSFGSPGDGSSPVSTVRPLLVAYVADIALPLDLLKLVDIIEAGFG